MSFDLYFLTRAPGQSWEEAHEAMGDAGEPVELSPERRALWGRIVTELAPVLPESENGLDDACAELDDETTGLQLSMYDSELALTVPYWHSGEEADRLVALLVDVVQVVERVTGLTAYDPQAEMPFLQGGAAEAGGSMSRIAESLRDGSLFEAAPPQPARRSLWQRLTGR
jgi:hypothetical protein